MEPFRHYVVSKKATIGKNVSIGEGAVIYDNVEIGDNAFIGPYCIIGEPTAMFYKNPNTHEFKKTIIGKNAIIRSFTTIYEDVVIGDFFQTGHHAIIREKTIIGHHTSFGSSSELPGRATIGNYVRIHSKVMLSENNFIEDYVWIFPFVVLTNVKHPPIGDFQVTRIKEYAQIFAQTTILPGITIGRNAIVGAGTMVTKDVGDERLVVGNPGRDIKSVRDIRDDDGNLIYPWRDYLTENRGYPWQINEF
ncbi:MAG TPA: DapH/DapD/GlmU-related protein [Williamwhitmania sp.]|nr:DapH/DapD/GlmU-related protein [Williamwhitmania sp.]